MSAPIKVQFHQENGVHAMFFPRDSLRLSIDYFTYFLNKH